MTHIPSQDAEEVKNSNDCTAYEYPVTDHDVGAAVVEITNRYPDSGSVVNKESKLLCYIIEGEGRLVLEEEIVRLEEGDVIVIEPEETYYWEGNLKLVSVSTPPWNPQQHELVDGEE